MLTKYLLLSSALFLSWMINIYDIIYYISDVINYTATVIYNRYAEMILTGIMIIGLYKILKLSKKLLIIINQKDTDTKNIISVIGHNNKLAREVSSDNTIYLTNYKYIKLF